MRVGEWKETCNVEKTMGRLWRHVSVHISKNARTKKRWKKPFDKDSEVCRTIYQADNEEYDVRQS